MIKIGLECENLEDTKSRWGIGKITLNLLEEYVVNSEWQKQYKLYLYFKSRVPDDDVLKNPIFVKRVLGFPSFNVFYHILMPLRAMWDRVDWMFFPAYQLPPLYLGKSVVLLTEDAYYEYRGNSLPFHYRLSYRIFTNWAARFATKILAISKTSKKNIAELYKIAPDKIFVNYLGVTNVRDIRNDGNVGNETIPTTPTSEAPLSGAERSNNSNYILFVGQMFPRRHAKETILAFEKLVAEHSNILQNVGMSDLKLVLVGPDKYPAPEQARYGAGPAPEKADAHGNRNCFYGDGAGPKPVIDSLVSKVNERLGRTAITHKDYVSNEELAKLYTGAKALVYVSGREAFGLPPMEALSVGVPPIIADNELGHELFGEFAFYVVEPYPEDIADSIRKALTDSSKVQKIKNDGPDFARQYNWRSFTDRFLKIIDEK